MAASRRAQIQSLCGARTGALIDRAESYLAAVDVWSRRGNQKAVKNAGTGVVAVCCYLAAESLDARVPDRGSAIRASGLPPAQFAAAERDFRSAVQSVSSTSSHTLSGPSDALNSAFAASLATTPTKRAVRSSPAKAPASAGKDKDALLAKAQAIQAGSLFDQAMRAGPEDAYSAANRSRTQQHDAGAAAPQSNNNVSASAIRANADTHAAANGDACAELQPRRPKRRRMSKVVFGLAIHSSLNRLNDQQEADDERRRRNRINHIQSTIERLRTSDPTWRYLDAPKDFLITVSPSHDGADQH